MVGIVIAIVVGAAALLLAIVLTRSCLILRHIARCTRDATGDELEAIYSEVECLGSESPTCAVMAVTNRTASSETEWAIPVPSFIGPWAGKVISVEKGDVVEFRLSDSANRETVLRGKTHRIIAVPRRKTKTGRAQNQFSPEKYIASNPKLVDALKAVCPAYPKELLSYLLLPGMDTFEFDPIFQARIGGNPVWIQGAEFPNCDQCKTRMSLILQLPGNMLPGKPISEGTFYFFGCMKHPDRTKTVLQFS